MRSADTNCYPLWPTRPIARSIPALVGENRNGAPKIEAPFIFQPLRAEFRNGLNLLPCYPSVGGDGDCDDLWPRFHAVVQEHAAVLRELVHRPVQTNEVGRCAALLGGFLEVARRTDLPLRLLEVGAAGGLMLRWIRSTNTAIPGRIEIRKPVLLVDVG